MNQYHAMSSCICNDKHAKETTAAQRGNSKSMPSQTLWWKGFIPEPMECHAGSPFGHCGIHSDHMKVQTFRISGVWFDKSKHSWKRGSMPGSPFVLEDKAPPPPPPKPPAFTDSPHPHKQETGGLDTIQATSFFPWWLLLFLQESFGGKGRFVKKYWNQEKSWENTGPRCLPLSKSKRYTYYS